MANEIQKKLRALRRRYNIPQREVAEATGLSVSAVSHYEIADPPSQRRLKQILTAIYRLAMENNKRPELRVTREV